MNISIHLPIIIILLPVALTAMQACMNWKRAGLALLLYSVSWNG